METEQKTIEKLNSFWQQQSENDFVSEQNLTDLKAAEILEIDDSENNGDKWLKILKGLFLFLPGVVFLFGGSLFMFYRFFGGEFGIFRVLIALPWLALWGFAVMFGIGKINDPKYLSLPISIMAFSLIIALFSIFLGGKTGWSFIANYSVYLFPIAFIAPIIVKELLED